MSDPLLTEDEKSALLEGVSSGAVEVVGNGGARYASVRRFDVSARSRIVTNSYPRLQALNQRLAEGLGADLGGAFQCDIEVRSTGLGVSDWHACRERLAPPAIYFLFSAAPLPGAGLVVLEAASVRRLVEAFFGNDAATAYSGGAAFTRGEKSVAARCCDALLAALEQAWRPVIEFSPERSQSEVSLELVDFARDADPVIACGFELILGESHGAFHVAWPRTMLTSLLPAFEGRLRERDAAADARWEEAIRRRLADVPVRVSTLVGEARHSVGALAGLRSGAVLPIANPRAATVFAGRVPVMQGRFGVIGCRNAVEATGWLDRKRAGTHSNEES